MAATRFTCAPILVLALRRVRYLIAMFVCCMALPCWAAPVPVGLQPGDQYHIIFATSFVTVISSDTTVPPALPAFGGLAAADYTVTFAAAQAGLVPGWNDLDITYKALLSTNGNDARDRITITGPVYNTNGFLIANSAADLWESYCQMLWTGSFQAAACWGLIPSMNWVP